MERGGLLYFVFRKEVEQYEPKGYVTVDVNENNVAVLADCSPYIFETDIAKITLGYYYRRKSVQKKYDKIYGIKCCIKRKTMKKFRKKKRKTNTRWKAANIIVREPVKRSYGIVLEDLGDQHANDIQN